LITYDFIYLVAANESDNESIASTVPEFPSDDAYQKEEDAIFIRNLPSTVKFNDLFDLFSTVGRIKVCLTVLHLYKLRDRKRMSDFQLQFSKKY
jgi:RNA recognition motif-containing protein